MSRNYGIELPGGTSDLPPNLWGYDKKNADSVRWLLEACGFNSDAPDIMGAVAGIHPITLTQDAVACLDEADRKLYFHERSVLGLEPHTD